MKKLLFLLCLPLLSIAQVQIGQTIDGEAADDFFGNNVAMSSDGTVVAISGVNNDGNGSESGHVRVYALQGDAWVQLGQDIDGEDEDDRSGSDISLSSDGTILAIGASNNDVTPNDASSGRSGHARIYNYDGSTWVQMGQDINGEGILDRFGRSISISSDGTRVAIGAPSNDGSAQNTGQVRVFDFEGGAWVSEGQAIEGVAQNDDCGADVELSADGNILAVGCPLFDVNGVSAAGQVRIYENQNGTWVQLGNDILGEGTLDFMGDLGGISLSSDGSIVAVSSANNDANGTNAGRVRVFNFDGNDWQQVGQDLLGDEEGEEFGSRVDLSSDGSILAVSAIFNTFLGVGTGRVQVFQNVNNTWEPIGESIYGVAEDNINGSGISLSDDASILAIGALGNDNANGASAGHTRIFDISNEILSAEEVVSQHFQLLPNPAKEFVTIQSSRNNSIVDVSIYNTLGQLVKNTTENQIDISSLESGIYIVKVATDIGRLESQKLIVN